MTKITNFPFVSVVIPNYNGENTICDCLRAVCASNYQNFEVILVDDASKDNSLSLVKEFFPQVKIIQNNINLGFARTANRGIRGAKGTIVVLLNMDTVVKNLWLSELIRVLVSDERIAMVGSKILNSDGITIQHAGGTVIKNGVSVHIGRGEVDSGLYNRLREVDYICGASMGIKKSLLTQIGYLDEGYSPLYYEDVDLAFRTKKRGFKIIYVPSSVLIHYENYSTGGLTAKFYFFYHKSRLRFIIKNYSFKYFLIEFLKAEIKFFMEFKPKEYKAQLIKAYLVNILSFPILLFYKLLNFNRDKNGLGYL